MLEIYQSVFIGFWVILSTIIIQALILVGAHRAQPGYQVGVIDPNLGQESFFFRSHRAFWNSLENIVPLFGLGIIAILSGYNAEKLNFIIWVYAISRIIHMILYYSIATDKNPSLRSLFWISGLFANIYLMVDLGLFLI
ncbi:MAG: MAPEG family protein [Gammaproteobacteria bacterium]